MSHHGTFDRATPLGMIPVEMFEQQIHATCGLFDIRPSKGVSEVWGGVAAHEKMGLNITNVDTDLQQIARPTQTIRKDDIDDYFFVVQRQGRVLMAQGDHATVLHPGDMMLIDSARPSEFSFFGERSRSVSLHVPRADLEHRFGMNIPGGVTVRRGDPTAMAIEAIIAKSRAVTESELHLRDALFNMLGVALLERDLGSQSKSSLLDKQECSVLTQAIGYIETRHHDPEVTPAMIAEDLRLQPYQIQRAFKSIGTTATSYLLTKRLETARTMLLEQAQTKQKNLISTVAYNSGFSDISYFNRRYRELFGCTPTETGYLGVALDA